MKKIFLILLGCLLIPISVCGETLDYKDDDIILPAGSIIELTTNKDAANGYPGLDGDGNITGVVKHRYLTEAEISAIVLEEGELAVASDALGTIYVGDGVTAGGAKWLPEYPSANERPEMGLGITKVDLGRTFTDLGQQGAHTYIYTFCNLGGESPSTKIVLAGTGNAAGHVYRSTNSGATWADSSSGQIGTSTGIRDFAYCGSGIVLAGTYETGAATIKRSTDYGDTWGDVTLAEYSENGFTAIAYLGNGIALCGGTTGTTAFLYRSTDYGATWTEVTEGGGGSPLGGNDSDWLWDLLPLDNGVVLAAILDNTNGASIVRSTGWGAASTWSEPQVLESTNKFCYCLANLGNGIVLAGLGSTTGKIYRSKDSGVTWTDIGQLGSATYVYSISYLGNGVAIACTRPDAHVFWSGDYGETWEDLGQQASESYAYGSAYIGDGITLVGTYNTGKILRSVAR